MEERSRVRSSGLIDLDRLPDCRCSSPTKYAINNQIRCIVKNDIPHLCFKLSFDTEFFFGLYENVEIIEIFDNKSSFLVHREQNLLDG